MSGAGAFFSGAFFFGYGFMLALLREWFYPALFIVLLVLFLTFMTMLIRILRRKQR